MNVGTVHVILSFDLPELLGTHFWSSRPRVPTPLDLRMNAISFLYFDVNHKTELKHQEQGVSITPSRSKVSIISPVKRHL